MRMQSVIRKEKEKRTLLIRNILAKFVKFGHSEKPTKLEKNLPLRFDITQ